MAKYKSNTGISGTGNSETRVNEITGDNLAAVRNFICGYSLNFKEAGCVVKDEGHDFNCSIISKNSIRLTDGLAFAYGYFGESEAVKFNILPPAVENYFIVYLEMNKSVVPNICEVKIKKNYANSRIDNNSFRQDELSTVKTGIYQIPLWLVRVTNQGVQELRDLRNLKEYIQKIVHSDYGTHVLDNGTIGQNVTIPTPLQYDISNKAVNTEFVATAIEIEIFEPYLISIDTLGAGNDYQYIGATFAYAGEDVTFKLVAGNSINITNVAIEDEFGNEYRYIKNNNTYNFTMPNANVVIMVYTEWV